MKCWTVIERVRVSEAHAATDFTYGFPPVSAFLGTVHGIERDLDGLAHFTGVAVIAHSVTLNTAKLRQRDLEHSVTMRRQPPNEKGNAQTLIEKVRAEATLSLVVETHCSDDADVEALAERIEQRVKARRLAGGAVMGLTRVRCVPVAEDPETERFRQRRIRRQLLPGFALVERSDLLTEHHRDKQANEDPQATMLDAWLDFATLARTPEHNDPEAASEWHTHPLVPANATRYLVPINTGYAAVSDFVANTDGVRDSDTPARFVESLHSIGQWISPHRLNNLDALLWRYDTSVDRVYRTRNDFTTHAPETAI